MSYSSSGSSVKLLFKTMPQLLHEQSLKHPHKEMLIFRDVGKPRVSITFQQMENLTNLYANTLISKYGVNFGDRVGVIASYTEIWPILDMAIGKTGGIPVRLHTTWKTEDDVVTIMNKTELKVLMFSADDEVITETVTRIFRKILHGDCTSSSSEGLISKSSVPSLKYIIPLRKEFRNIKPIDYFLKSKLTAEEKNCILDREKLLDPDSPYSSFLTSGSTGLPKASIMTNFLYINSCVGMSLSTGFIKDVEKDIYFSDRPFSHSAGVIGYINTLALGITCVLMKPTVTQSPKNIDFVIDVLEEESVTCGLFFAYILFDFAKSASANAIDKFKNMGIRGFTGGQIVPPSLMKIGIELMPSFINLYGSTEMMLMAAGSFDDSEEARCQYIGKCLPNYEITVRDSEELVVPPKTVGEIWIRGCGNFRGYWKDIEKTKISVTSSGWFRSGDDGLMNENGYIKVVGRQKDMIIRGALNIYPLQITHILLKHNAINTAAVVGVKNARLGEDICACIEYKKGMIVKEEELNELFAEGMMSIKPHHFLFFPNGLPKNSSGKTDILKLKEIASEKCKIIENEM